MKYKFEEEKVSSSFTCIHILVYSKVWVILKWLLQQKSITYYKVIETTDLKLMLE